MLSNASHLAHLSPETLDTLTKPEARYLVGWSCGKETLRDGVVDTFKGSYYVNCAFGSEGQEKNVDFDPEFPEYTSSNVWPTDAQLPAFQSSLLELCSLIIDVAVLVARSCDRFASENVPDYQPGYLERVVRTSTSTKARLLHYFPQDGNPALDGAEDDDWCATHLDHGCLTGLTSAMFIDESHSSTSLEELLLSPDPAAGLYIRSRTDQTVKVNIPKDCLAFQTGEALQLITKGKLRAVPHFVRGAKMTGSTHSRIARNTLAVFTQPNLSEEVESGRSFADFARGVVEKNTK